MRKITQQSVTAFMHNRKFKSANMEVKPVLGDYAVTRLYLCGNLIAERSLYSVKLYHCGWLTPTTKERLNGILRAMNQDTIYQKKGVWYRNGQEFFTGEEISYA